MHLFLWWPSVFLHGLPKTTRSKAVVWQVYRHVQPGYPHSRGTGSIWPKEKRNFTGFGGRGNFRVNLSSKYFDKLKAGGPCVEGSALGLDCQGDTESCFFRNNKLQQLWNVVYRTAPHPHLRLCHWTGKGGCFSVSKWLRSSRQEWAAWFLLVRLYTAAFDSMILGDKVSQ